MAQKDIIQHQISDLQKGIDSAGQAEKKAIADLETERKKPATVQTVTKYVKVPGQFEVVTTPAGPILEIKGDPQTNLDALQDFGIKCQECEESLAARNTQYSDLQKQLVLSEKNAKNWENAAGHKTGFWARVKEWSIRSGFAAGGWAIAKATK